MDLTHGTPYYLEPGYIFFSKKPAAVRTVLGTCVAVCIWDRELKFGGMNHFIHPRTTEAVKATPQYGNVATAALIRIMEEAGSQRENMIAQIVGGAAPEANAVRHVGDENVRVAREVLQRKGVSIVSEDTSGSVGRKLLFETGTGQLAVLKVYKIRATDWLA